MSFADENFDTVISSAVLHFAGDEEQWHLMVEETWRVLKPGGIFFARLASITGMGRESPADEGTALSSADGSDRFLVDEEMLVATANCLGGYSLDPVKRVIVHNMRSMTRWWLRKK